MSTTPAGFITGELAGASTTLTIERTPGGRMYVAQDGERITKDGRKADVNAALQELLDRQEGIARELAESREAEAAARELKAQEARAKREARNARADEQIAHELQGTTATMDSFVGKQAEVQISGSMSLSGGSMVMPEFITGKVAEATASKSGARRWKVGRRVVDLHKIASVSAITEPTPEPTPAPAPAAPATEQLTVEQVTELLPGKLRQYAEQHASADRVNGPLNRLPHVNLGRLYIALNGNPGLLEWLAGNGELATAGKRLVSAAVQALGAKRQPVSYPDPVKGNTSAGYWWLPLSVLGDGELAVEAWTTQRAQGQDSPAAASLPLVVPQRPDGNEADARKLEQLWKRYDEARATYKNSHGKKISDEKKSEYREQLHEAHGQLVEHRRQMDAKLEADRQQPTA